MFRAVIQAVIFDVGGVLVQMDWDATFAPWDRRCGLAPGGVLGELFRDFDDTVLIGAAAADDQWVAAGRRLGLSDDELTELMRDLDAAETFNTELETYILGLRPRYRTAILSNSWTERRTLHRRPRLDHLVDHVVLSAEVGVAKPAAEVFHIALDRLGVAPPEAVMVDDQDDVIAAARLHGLHAIRYQSNAQTIRALDSLLGRGA